MLGLIARTGAEIKRDVAAAHSRDPAARGVWSWEILATWPGVHAVLAHRVAHALHGAGVPLMPRAIAATARSITGIEIHPAAEIGESFFIDHGMGVVIGETAQVGDNVTLYQGVTLGGTSWITTLLAPIFDPWPTVIGPSNFAPEPIVTLSSTVGCRLPVAKPVPPSVTPW